MPEMTISQALRLAKKLKGQISVLRTRAAVSVSHRKDSPPAFEFDDLYRKLEGVSSELSSIEGRIIATNASTFVEHSGTKITLAHAVRILADLKGQIAWLNTLSVRSRDTTSESDIEYRAGVHQTVITEWTCHLPEALRAEKVDALQAEFDALNDVVERINGSKVLGA